MLPNINVLPLSNLEVLLRICTFLMIAAVFLEKESKLSKVSPKIVEFFYGGNCCAIDPFT